MFLSEDAAASRKGEQNGKPDFHEDVLLGLERFLKDESEGPKAEIA